MKGVNMCSEKSIVIAYVLWFFGGLFGVHHFYLRRDRHAFAWWTTLGGFGIGWLGEVLRIRRYVDDANEDQEYMKGLVRRMLKDKKPPFSLNRFSGMLMVGYTWGQMMSLAVPPENFGGYNLRYLNHFVPFAVALGVWTVGNIGREKGNLKWPILAAYAAYPLRFYIYDESLWFTLMVLASCLAFDSFSKEWRRSPCERKHIVRRVIVLTFCASIYLSLWCGYLYFHGTITDTEGDEVPLYEAIHHFFTSPWWLDVKQCIVDTYQYAQHHGWYEVWKQIIDLSDLHGEQNAYKVLGLGPQASQQEITSRWRMLSREHHPDKAKPEHRREAQDKFMDIQRAYELLSKSKHRRHRRNRKDNSNDPIISEIII